MEHNQHQKFGMTKPTSPILYSHGNPTIKSTQDFLSNSSLKKNFDVDGNSSSAQDHNPRHLLKSSQYLSTFNGSQQKVSIPVNSELNLYDPELISLEIHDSFKTKSALLSPPTSACSEFNNYDLNSFKQSSKYYSSNETIQDNEILQRAFMVCKKLAVSYSFVGELSFSQIASSLPTSDHNFDHNYSSEVIFQHNMDILMNYFIKPLEKKISNRSGIVTAEPPLMHKGKEKELYSSELPCFDISYNGIATKENNEITKNISLKPKNPKSFLNTKVDLPNQDFIQYTVINLRNSKEMNNYYCECFRNILQIACKTIAKFWIKVIEPKKQTNFPYKGGNKTRPQWWPSEVIHREPDHLKINERIKLLIAMIRNPNIDINILKNSTSDWQRKNNNNSKLEYLEAAYKLAEKEREKGVSNEDNEFTVRKLAPFQRIRRRSRQNQQLNLTKRSSFYQEAKQRYDTNHSQRSEEMEDIIHSSGVGNYKDQGSRITPSTINEEPIYIYNIEKTDENLTSNQTPGKLPALGIFEKVSYPPMLKSQTDLHGISDFKSVKQNHQVINEIKESCNLDNKEHPVSKFGKMGDQAFEILGSESDTTVDFLGSPGSVCDKCEPDDIIQYLSFSNESF